MSLLNSFQVNLRFIYPMKISVSQSFSGGGDIEQWSKMGTSSQCLSQFIFPFCKVNNRGTRKMRKICSNLTKKHQSNVNGSGVFIITFEHTSHIFLVFLLLTLNK